MNVETETLILKTIEKLDQKLDKFIETTNHKLDKFIETTNHKFDYVNTSLTSIQVNQGIQGEQIKALQKGQDDLKADLSTFKAETKENFKEVKSELKETRNDVSGLYKWVIGLILTAIIGAGTIIFRVFELWTKA